MISEQNPYAAHKDSGVPELGKVPNHWDVQRLGSLLQAKREPNAKGEVTEI